MTYVVVPRTDPTKALEILFPSWPAWARVFIQYIGGSGPCLWIVSWPGNVKCVDPPSANPWSKWEPILGHLAPSAPAITQPIAPIAPSEQPPAPGEIPIPEVEPLTAVLRIPLIPAQLPANIAPSEISRMENAFPNLFRRS